MTGEPGISERDIERVEPDGTRRGERDRLVVEAPLEVRCGGQALVVVMRTPGDDVELARGLLTSEGVLRTPGELAAVRSADPAQLRAGESGNVIEVDLDPELVRRRWPSRALYASSSCGVCGKTSIDELSVRAAAITAATSAPRSVLAGLPDRLRESQRLFVETGGLHAAAAFTVAGELVALREDVGRHNAVDKLVGWLAWAGKLPAHDLVLCVSGRLGFEIAQKAIVAGFPIAVAVSAPSSLAVDLAERFRVALCGFARGGRLNVYSHSTRVE